MSAVRGAEMLRLLRERCPRLHLALYIVLKYKRQSLLTGLFPYMFCSVIYQMVFVRAGDIEGGHIPPYTIGFGPKFNYRLAFISTFMTEDVPWE